jgi:arginyl-tRNA--protein-N-Asp/Glu arginylyltransferase
VTETTCADPAHKHGWRRSRRGKVVPHCWTCARARDLRHLAERNAKLRRITAQEIEERTR